MGKKTTPVVRFALKNNALALNIMVFGRGVVSLNAETTQDDLEFLFNFGFTDLIEKIDGTAQSSAGDGTDSDATGEAGADESLG